MPLYYAQARCTWTHNGDGTITVAGPCVVTGKETKVTIKKEELEAYNKGAYIQNAFKSLSADDREFLMSGHSADGWRQTFNEEDE